MSQVKEHMMVTIEFSIRTTSPHGEVAELPPQTSRFVFGIDAQYPSVESALQNKKCGDRIHVYVPPEELYGHHDPSLVRELPRKDYKQTRLAEGKMYREMKKMTLVQFLVKELRDDVIVADFNDPRAGTSAEFDILIKDIRGASPEELRPSCARGPEIMAE
ncbi:FKBP-type peptidyl-prolyl cis-trans isomerase [Desulforhabdus amnigena]|jgi:FKBP-type peptidyl-prolyl cis-trans isomerase SlyD|uniref:peptidylprolyl isomerase n=1 Tax=Desulforhabdus amnigena TaxID=40218 RepID=A0A9W6L903_9BACT|nr:hypothetical protein [Desulforhabdus amnigena]NLJ29080.1 hypothetical protein [Deltaproteobacteria bacterium]GLI35189.1 hypothetical protein DAMNIGENAA_26220 [Desulforhabdus amnigena]